MNLKRVMGLLVAAAITQGAIAACGGSESAATAGPGTGGSGGTGASSSASSGATSGSSTATAGSTSASSGSGMMPQKTVLVPCSQSYPDPNYGVDHMYAEYLVPGVAAVDLVGVRAAGLLTDADKELIQVPPMANITWATAQVQIGDGRVLVKCTRPIDGKFGVFQIYSAVQFVLP